MITRTASEIAEICGAELEGDGSIELVGPASLREARENEVSFLANPLYRPDLEATRAGAVVVDRQVRTDRADLALLRCDDPNASFTRVIEAFRPPAERPAAGVHPTAWVAPTARLGRDVSVGPAATVGEDAELGDGVVLGAGVHVGAEARIGEGTVVRPGCVLERGVVVGRRCTLHAGTVLGSDGFGFEPTPEGWRKVPQCGTVVVEDDVEIGANCAIDRARFGATRIGRGAKLDNLVHVAHNVVVEAGALLIAQVGISGSTRIGRGAIVAGQAGVGGHLEVGDGARIGAKSGVSSDVPPGEDWFGYPAVPKLRALRAMVAAPRVPALLEAVRGLRRRIEELERGRDR